MQIVFAICKQSLNWLECKFPVGEIVHPISKFRIILHIFDEKHSCETFLCNFYCHRNPIAIKHFLPNPLSVVFKLMKSKNNEMKSSSFKK